MAAFLEFANGVIQSSKFREFLIGLATTTVVLFLSRTASGRTAKIWIAGKISRLDPERARTTWLELTHDLEGLSLTTEASIFALRQNGMPYPRMLPSPKPADLAWMDDPSVIEDARGRRPAVNKTHGFVSGSDFRRSDHFTLSYVSTDYAMVLAARNAGHLPPILSANALVFCAPTRRLVLMIRSPKVRTYPKALHFLGGNFEPRSETEEFDDADQQSPLRRTAIREIWEESKIEIAPPENGYVIVGQEHSTGFIQFTYAALYVTEGQVAKMKPSGEGELVAVSLAELEAYVETGIFKCAGTNSNDICMTPSLALTLLGWLKIGAPSETGTTPIRREAEKVYDRIKNRIKTRIAMSAHG